MDMGHAMVGAEQKAQSTLNGWTRQLDMGAWDNAAHKVQSYKKRKPIQVQARETENTQAKARETENTQWRGKGGREWGPCIEGKVKRRRGFFMVGLAGDSRPGSRQGMGDNKTFMAASGQGDRKPCMGRGGRLYALGTLHKRGMTGATGVPKGAKQG